MSAKAAAVTIAGVKLVDRPIQVPIRRGRAGTGLYFQLLSDAAKLKATSIETGLDPHFEWSCEDHKQLRSRMTGLSLTKRKNKDLFSRVFFMQRSNPEEKKFTVYIWREG